MGLFDRLRKGDKPRVAFFGIDGVPYSLLSSHPDLFPNVASMMDEGVGGAIESIVPPESSACWPSLTTGVNPGKTGVYGFQDREVGSYETYVPMGRDVQAERLWDRIQQSGREATVMNVPVTFPPQRTLQRMVSGFLSPDLQKSAYPDEFRRTLEQLDYRIDVDAKLGHEDDKREFIENAHQTIDARYRAFEHFVEQDDWDLFFGVFMTTDRVNHFLFEDYEANGEYYDEFLEFYQKLDEYLGNLHRMVPDDVTTIIASDHGFTTLDYEVHLNEWLQSKGWLSYRRDDHEELGDIADEAAAYSLIPGRFYINLEGREPRGSVAEADYESTREELKAQLQTLTGPDGTPVFDRIVEREEAFRGDHDTIAPDLVGLPNPGYDLKAGFKGHDEIFDKGPRNGMHSFTDATLIIDDPEAVVSEANLYDIAPTILQIMDIEYDRSGFDGATLI